MSDICPCCKQLLPWKRKEANKEARTQSKMLRDDLAKLQRSIDALYAVIANPQRTFIGGPWEESMKDTEIQALLEACQLEIERLTRASTDHKLLWSIYRRNAKGATAYAS